MPTISQLPSTDTISASDLIPISQDGSAHSVSVGALLAQTQPAIIVGPPSLLGRISIGPGGPDTIAVGDGLTLNNGTLSASGFNKTDWPLQTSLAPDDQILVNNAGAPQLVGLNQIRQLFTAGSNITIDPIGVISTSDLNGAVPYSLATLSPVSTLASEDLIGVSQNGRDYAVTYANLLGGLTIDLAPTADPASDSDAFWVAQASNIMLRQTLGATWPWILAKLPLWKRRVIELSANTTLEEAAHHNTVLVCSSPIRISAVAANMVSGFYCELINASSGPITFDSSILASTGSNGLLPYQCGAIHCITYSGGTTMFLSISAGSSVIIAPGQPFNLTVSSVSSASVTLSWSAPISGGPASIYTVQYRIIGTIPWLSAGQTSGATNLIINGLQAATSYDLSVSAMNNIGTGPTSSTLTATTFAIGLLPGAPSALSVTNIGANSVTCSWIAPVVGGTGILYRVQYKVVGQTVWNSAASNLSPTTVSITGLIPVTSYDIQVIASNDSGSGPPSAPVTTTTAQAAGLVISISWNWIDPQVGSIGGNVHVNPATAQVQFGVSQSAVTPPTVWVAGNRINTDLWGAYVTPASAGSWYLWAEGTDGSTPTVYATPFIIT